jgi:hypothetical protein
MLIFQLDREYSKIPQSFKNMTGNQRQRKEDLELELEIVDKNISHIKQKMRKIKLN